MDSQDSEELLRVPMAAFLEKFKDKLLEDNLEETLKEIEEVF